MSSIKSFTPRAPKRHLLFLAAFVWTFAGGILLFRGLSALLGLDNFAWAELLICIIGGVIFYLVLFSGISLKHSKRILELENERPCLFSFFNLKSYFLMATMIGAGVLLRKSGIIPTEYLSLGYVTMGIPLFLSSFRFYDYGINYYRTLKKTK
jgi:hypothetical protein